METEVANTLTPETELLLTHKVQALPLCSGAKHVWIFLLINSRVGGLISIIPGAYIEKVNQ